MFRALLKYSVIRNKKVLTINNFQSFTTSFTFNDKYLANINFKRKTVELKSERTLKDETKKLEFPFVWLRDNCQCEMCHHASSYSRIINWENFDETVEPKHVMYNKKLNKLEIKWNDAAHHESKFDLEWLHERNFTARNQKYYLDTFYRPAKELLDKSNFVNKIDYYNYHTIINEDLELYKWLHSMITKGVSIIENVPASENEVRHIATRIGFIRRTHYGEEFVVKAKEGTSNVAYLSENLQMHTDLPYYDYAPGVNLLHCLVQSKSKGAQNLLTDGFYIAEKMRKNHPEDFNILSKISVNWLDIGAENNVEFHSIYRAPMICLDYDGNLNRINHSIPQRDSFFTVSIDDAQRWYKALAKFVNLLYTEAIEFKTQEGTILCFDNSRLIHGRRKYEDSRENQRHVIGAYLDWDEMFSRYRVLQKKFSKF